MNSQPQYILKKINALKSYDLQNFIDLIQVFYAYSENHQLSFFTESQKRAFQHIKEPQFNFNTIFDNKDVFDFFLKLLKQQKDFKLSKKLKAHLSEEGLGVDTEAIARFSELVCFYNLIKKIRNLTTPEFQTIYKDFYEIQQSENIPNYFQNKQNYESLNTFITTYSQFPFLEKEKSRIIDIIEYW